MGIPICGACRRPIEERVVTALGKHFHVEVYTCYIIFEILCHLTKWLACIAFRVRQMRKTVLGQPTL